MVLMLVLVRMVLVFRLKLSREMILIGRFVVIMFMVVWVVIFVVFS